MCVSVCVCVCMFVCVCVCVHIHVFTAAISITGWHMCYTSCGLSVKQSMILLTATIFNEHPVRFIIIVLL